METEFKIGFGRFIRCACRVMGIPIKDDTIIQTWTRTRVKNDLEEAQIAASSKNVIADEDIVRKHPWVEDFERSWKAFEEQQEANEKEISDMFPQQEKDPDGPEDGQEGDG